MPGRSVQVRAQASTAAPVLPAETSACASPDFTSRAPTKSDASGLALSASEGFSFMPMNSEACCTEMRSALCEVRSSTFWMRAASPTSRVWILGASSESRATPFTTSSGA